MSLPPDPPKSLSPRSAPPSWLTHEAIVAPLASQFPSPGTRTIVRDDWIQVVRPHQPNPSRNEVIFSRMGDDVEAVLDRTFAEYAAIPTAFKWSVPEGSTPADLGDRLRARGMTAWWARAMSCPTDLVVEGSAEDVSHDTDRFEAVSARGWSAPEARRAADRQDFATAAATGRSGFFVTSGGEGSAAVILTGRAGYLMGAVVLPEHRGQGHYAALLAARLRWLRDRDVEYAITLAREATSAPILEHRGFYTLFRYEVFQFDG
jgi:GNAT superfamily N-acetyltransferase